jgi:23S rRNA A2030 N6-methylase RlmJ
VLGLRLYHGDRQMAYDHSIKIGNQGDLVKHIGLFAALRHVLAAWSADQEFVYADIHAGRPAYVLPEKGEWQYGIGSFSELPEVDDDRERREKGTSLLGAAGAFDAVLLGRSVAPGMIYLGSSGIAFRLLCDLKVPWRMKLWEMDRTVASDIEAHFRSHADRIKVTCSDGYEILKDDSPCSFVLIDPPALEAADVLETMAKLNGRGIPFLCWTPRTSRSVQPTMPNGEWTAAEAGTSSDYIQRATKHGACLRVQWQPWGCRTPGCCITVSTGLSGIVSAAIKQLVQLMGWSVEA